MRSEVPPLRSWDAFSTDYGILWPKTSLGAGVPSVGWGLTVVFGGPAFKDVIFRFSLFGMAFVVLFLISFFSFQQKDYVAERDDR